MQITIDTRDLSDLDKQVLSLLAGGAIATVETKATPAPAKKAAAATPAPKAEPTPEPEAETTEAEPTLQTAIDLATAAVADGKTADVKAALATAGVKRVSELKGDAIAEFVKNVQA